MPTVVDISPSGHQSEYDGPEGVFANLGTNNGFEMTWCDRHQEYEFNPVGMADSTGYFDCGVGGWSDLVEPPDDEYGFHLGEYYEETVEDPRAFDPDVDLASAGRDLDLVPATYLNGHRDLAEQF